MGCTGFMNVVHKLCALHTPLKPRILAKFSSENKQALPINTVIVNLIWKYNDLTLKSKLTLSTLISSFLENKYNTNSEYFIYMHLISTNCVLVLVTESIFFVVFLIASQFWHHQLNKIFWQNKMLFRPTIPSFFQPETWNTHIFFWPYRYSHQNGKNTMSTSILPSLW